MTQLLKERIFLWKKITSFNPIALRKAKIIYSFGLSESNRVKKETDLEGFPGKLTVTKVVLFRQKIMEV